MQAWSKSAHDLVRGKAVQDPGYGRRGHRPGSVRFERAAALWANKPVAQIIRVEYYDFDVTANPHYRPPTTTDASVATIPAMLPAIAAAL